MMMETKPISILIIDSDPTSGNYLAVMLRKSGFSVLSTAVGREGLVLAWKDHPEIILLDPDLPDMTGLELVMRLRKDRRTSGVPCVILSSKNEPEQADTFLAAGGNEYLVKSGQTLPRLLEMIPRLVQKKSTASKKLGILVSFLSSKGGTGTSSLCANIAMCLGSDKEASRIAVMDMVLPIGSIADIVGYDDRLNLFTAAMLEPNQITAGFFREKLPSVPGWNFHLLAGSPDPGSANQLAVDRLEKILTAIQQSHDFILVDLGRSLSRISLPVIQRSDVTVLVVGTDLSSAILTKTIWEYLKGLGIEPEQLYTLQNRAVGLEGLSKMEFEQLTGMAIRVTLPYMSGNFTLANNRHEPILSKYPGESPAMILMQAAREIAELGQKRHEK